MSSQGTLKRRREKRVRRQARRVGKQKPIKRFFLRVLDKVSKRLFGRNIFRKWIDSPLQPKGTKPNPAWNEIHAVMAADVLEDLVDD